MASRTMKLTFRGTSIHVREGSDGRIEFQVDGHHKEAEAKSFDAATNEARKWLLANAGEMKGNYER